MNQQQPVRACAKFFLLFLLPSPSLSCLFGGWQLSPLSPPLLRVHALLLFKFTGRRLLLFHPSSIRHSVVAVIEYGKGKGWMARQKCNERATWWWTTTWPSFCKNKGMREDVTFYNNKKEPAAACECMHKNFVRNFNYAILQKVMSVILIWYYWQLTAVATAATTVCAICGRRLTYISSLFHDRSVAAVVEYGKGKGWMAQQKWNERTTWWWWTM
jgi:L-amino acid N-acyltransferase YncA